MLLYTAYLFIISLIAFVAYVLDKKRAIKNQWRIPETALLALSFLGGALGGYAAMHLVRHKTKKWYFHFVNVCGLVWQIALWIFLYTL